MTEKKSFNAFLKSRRKVDDLVSKIEKFTESKKKSQDFNDERFFKYTKDKAGNAFVILRFLPTSSIFEGQSDVVMRFRHFFSINGRWLIENCPTSPILKKQCPICTDNGRWYDENSDEYKEKGKDECRRIGGQRKRRYEYFANIYIIKDSQCPENNGKVKIWQFGEKVYEKIQCKLKPTKEEREAGIEPVDVFSFDEGSNFVLNIYTKDGFSKYDKCTWQPVNKIFENDDDKKIVYENIHSLGEFIDPKSFKSYDELEERLNYVLGKIDKVKKKEKTIEKKTEKKHKEIDTEQEQIAEKKADDFEQGERDSSVNENDSEESDDIDELFEDYDN